MSYEFFCGSERAWDSWDIHHDQTDGKLDSLAKRTRAVRLLPLLVLHVAVGLFHGDRKSKKFVDLLKNPKIFAGFVTLLQTGCFGKDRTTVDLEMRMDRL